MKKILIILFTVMMIIGCTNKEETLKKEYELKYSQMEEKLMEIGKTTFENDSWLNDETLPIDEMTSQIVPSVEIFIKLSTLTSNEGYDTSIFINPKTNEKCDFEKSGIKLVFNGKNSETGKYDYEISSILVCGQED